MQNWNDLIRTQLDNLASFPPKQTWMLGEWIGECAVRPEAANFAALPLVGNEVGDVRVSLADQAWYIWDGAAWQSMSGGGGGAVNSVTASGPLASSGGVNPNISLTGIVAPANGGTGIALPGALNNVLTSDGAGGWTSSAPSGGTVTGVTATGPLASSGGATPDISLTGIVAAANGGTGIALPGALNNVLTSDGAGGWTSSAPSGGATAQGGANAIQYANAATPTNFDGNANFVYDEATGRLGVGTAAPSTTLHVNSGAVNGTAIATLQNTAGDFQVFRVDANPEGSVTGSIGDIADDSTNGVVYVKTSGSATNTGWSPLANLGTKVFLVVEGGQYATIQDAINATPTGTNVIPAYSVILVGPKANTGGGASGSWGPAVLAANKSLMITGLGGAQTAKDIRIDSLTFDSSAAGLNANINENYVSGLYITSSSVTSVVTYSGTGAIRLRLNNCYVVNTGAGDVVTNTNSNVSGSLYLDTCIVSAESTTGIAVKSSGYTVIRNRSEISTIAGGTNLSTGRSLSASAGVVEIYDCFVGGASVPRPVVELTGTAYLASGYTTINNTSNDANARCVFVNSATATFAAGDASLPLGSSVAVAGQVVSGTGTFAFGNITFSFSPLLTVATQTPALRTGGWFTTDIKEGISLTSPGSPLFNLNSSGRITRYNDAAPTNGQLLIGDTAAGYFKSASLTAGSGVTITPGAGSVTIAATGVGGAGVAAQLAYFTSASAIGSETGVGADALTWDATNNRLGVGTNTPTTAVDVATGQVAIPDGTAAAPAIAFRDDLNTGFYSPSNDIVGIAVNGAEVARFQQSGAGNTPVMLMGTSTVYGAISVDSSDASGAAGVVMLAHAAAGTTFQEAYRGGQFAGVRSRGTKAAPTAVASGDGLVNMLGAGWTATGGINYGGLVTFKAEEAYTATASGGRIEFHTTTSGTDGFTTLGSATTERMRITNAGNVGIGTATPNEKLTVNGVLSLAEGTAPTNTAAFGKLWANSAADARPYWVDDTGQSFNLTLDRFNTLTPAASVAIDTSPALPVFNSLALNQNTTFTTTNLGNGRSASVRVVGDASTRTLTFPVGWTWLGSGPPSSLAANDIGYLSITAYGVADTDVVAAWSYENAPAVVIGGGVATQVAYFSTSSTISSETAVGSNSFTWDATNNRLGVGTATPTANLHVAGNVLAKNATNSTTAFQVQDAAGAVVLDVDTTNFRVGIGAVPASHPFEIYNTFAVAAGGRIHTYDGSAPTDGQILIGTTAGGNFAKAAITAGTGISVTNAAGSITLAATGGIPSTAQEALNAGDLVRFVNDAGTPKVQKADATNTDARLNPVGFAVAAASAGGAVTIQVTGVADVPAARFDVAPAAADVGKRVFVSTTSGKITLTAPSASGDVLQRAGVLTDGGANPKVLVQIGDPTLL